MKPLLQFMSLLTLYIYIISYRSIVMENDQLVALGAMLVGLLYLVRQRRLLNARVIRLYDYEGEKIILK